MGRYTTSADITAYGAAIIAEGMPPMQVNDVIFFASERNPSGNLRDISAWPLARNGATMWIEGGPVTYNGIRIGSSSALSAPSDIDNPNHVCFFGGRGNVTRGPGGLSGLDMQIYNYDNLVLDFETNSYPGLRDGWGSGRSGTFGLKNQQSLMTKSGMSLMIDNSLHTMKSLQIRGCELTMGGFAKIRALTIENHLEKFIIERNLITRSLAGEGLYIGMTSRQTGGDWLSFKNFWVKDNIFAFTAAEALQLQQVCDGSRVCNNVIVIAATDYKSAFQPFQDTGIQLVLGQGNVWFYDNVMVGWASSGLHIFGTDLARTDQTIKVPFGSGVPRIFNNVLSGGKAGHAIRIHTSFDGDPDAGVSAVPITKMVFRDNDIPSSVRSYYTEIGSTKNFHADVAASSFPVEFIGGNYPNDGHPFLNPANSNMSVKHFGMTAAAQEEPVFVNSGFDGIDIHRISRWSECLEVGNFNGNFLTVINPDSLTPGGSVSIFILSTNTFAVGNKIRVVYRDEAAPKSFYGTIQSIVSSTITINNISHIEGSGASDGVTRWDMCKIRPYVVGEFVWLAEYDESIPFELYRCIQNHEATVGDPHGFRPEVDTTRWEKVWWDANGKNMYDPLYNGVPVTTDFMNTAGDFRLKKGTYHHGKRRGLKCNEQPDDKTMMGWQWKQTEDGTVRDIPGAYDATLDVSQYSYLWPGRFLRSWVKVMLSTGVFADIEYSEWSELT